MKTRELDMVTTGLRTAKVSPQTFTGRFWRKAVIRQNANVSKVPNSEHVLVGKDVSCTG